MKTDDGWIRGTMCCKTIELFAPPTYVCALCGKQGQTERELCFPVPLSRPT